MHTSVKRERGGWAGNTAHGEMQQRALVRAAYQIIAEKGFEGLRTRDVADRAGVNIATLHYYFATKEDLIRAVVALMHDLFAGLHVAGLPVDPTAIGDPVEELREDLADVPYKWRTEPQLYIVMVELYLRSLRDPSIRAMMADLEDHWTQYLAIYLARGVAEGAFRQDLDIPTLATMLRTTIKGLILEIMTYGEAVPTERLFVEIERWISANTCP
jgi:AcrR family transcriptional regulator